MVKYFLMAVTLLAALAGKAQRPISNADLNYLITAEDSLYAYADKLLEEADVVNRLRADSSLTKILVRALKLPYSFYYPFDSLTTVTIVYPADSSFRIFTWMYQISDDVFRQKGAIQMKTADGSLHLFPLFDASDYTQQPNDSIRKNTNWIGAIYYKIIQTSYNNKPYYTLLGYDENGLNSTKKWIDVLTFDDNQQPVFGGDYFVFDKTDSAWQPHYKRFNIEFRKEGRARLNYDAEKQIILYDHLISENNEPQKKYTYIPDGDYEGMEWKDGKWHHISKVFTEQLTDGKEPQPELLMNENGVLDENKLQAISEKNADKKVEAKNYKKKAKVALPPSKKKS